MKFPGCRPITGAASTPASPAKNVLTAHTPADTAPGFVPESAVIASESTSARTRRPTSVNRRTSAPITTGRDDAPVDDELIHRDRNPGDVHGLHRLGREPGGQQDRLVAEQQQRDAGKVTDNPMVATTLTSDDDRRRKRKSTKYRTSPSRGATTTIETIAAGRIDHSFWTTR